MAIEDMMEETATNYAPWHLIPTNNKSYGRIAALSRTGLARMCR
jgi:AMP-polyphosphate phosphotransferase